jgi:hypothetical protein
VLSLWRAHGDCANPTTATSVTVTVLYRWWAYDW